MIFTSMLVRLGLPSKIRVLCEPLCKKSSFISGGGLFAVAAGIMSGCPLGAKTACELYAEGQIGRSEAQRLTFMCNNTGPMFVVGVVGESLLGDKKTGIVMLIIQYLSAFAVSVCHSLIFKNDKGSRTKPEFKAKTDVCSVLNESVMSAVGSITLVGGFIVLFSVICAIVQKCGSEALLQGNEGLLFGILEVTNGAGKLSALANADKALICGIIAWGGLSVHAQSSAFIRSAGLSVRKYIIGKLFIGIFAYITAKIVFNFI